MSSKPHLEYHEQIELLKSRGLEIPDKEIAYEALQEIGYYKLSAYMYPLKEFSSNSTPQLPERSDIFQEGATFAHVLSLYNFDRELASILVNALRDFEQFLRAQTAFLVGRGDPYAHLNQSLLHKKLTEVDHERWKYKFEKDIKNAREQEFVRHHRLKYEKNMPIWVATEVMSFGTLSYLIGNLSENYQGLIANKFGFESRHFFAATVSALLNLRNDCVHLNRLWNAAHTPHLRVERSFISANPELRHLIKTPPSKIYVRIALLAYVLSNHHNGNQFRAEIQHLISHFPEVPNINPNVDMGFPEDWSDMSFWRNKT